MSKLIRVVALVASSLLFLVPASASSATSKPSDYDPISMEAANVGYEIAVARFATAVNADAFGRLVQANMLIAWVSAHTRTIPNVTHSGTRVVTSGPAPVSGGGSGCARGTCAGACRRARQEELIDTR